MEIEVVTLFPEMFESVLEASLLGKAQEAGLLTVRFTNPRDFATDKHRTVDDTPYGGGAGMVMKVEPLVAAVEHAVAERGPAHRILMAPVGKRTTHEDVVRLAGMPRLLLVCGRYEGIDERVVDLCIDESLSIGDFVLTGGEIAAMALIDAVARFVPGVLGDAASARDESFATGLLEYPHYTRPREFRGLAVPDVLLQGNHKEIEAWRRRMARERTRRFRPDLLGGGEEDDGGE